MGGELSYWQLFLQGLVLSIAIECPILAMGLSPQHPLKHRLATGVWLTLCTYPIVFLVLPSLLYPYIPYKTFVLIAETIVITCEWGLFISVTAHYAWRDLLAILIANIASIAAGIRWLL